MKFSQQRHRSGFTLVELLVATGLIVLMMSLFAQIFQLAGGSISTQRGIMENDQRSRTLELLIRGDVEKRTFQIVYPFAPAEGQSASDAIVAQTAERQGYFYISENDPNDPTDDVLKFTIATNPKRLGQFVSESESELPPEASERITGRATAISPGAGVPWFASLNQPEGDDGWFSTNSRGESDFAEVTYFMRRGSTAGRLGTLYRRIQLIRQENGAQSEDPTVSLFQPGGGYWSPTAGPAVRRNFWSDFDYSGSYDRDLAASDPSTPIQFNGESRLMNVGLPVQLSSSVPGYPRFLSAPLGVPHFRFGHERVTGLPLEFVRTDAANRGFIGAYTAEETSAVYVAGVTQGFCYPAGLDTSGLDPMDQTNVYAGSTLPLHVVAEYQGGIRRGEDVVLAHVHEFDVKVWDDVALDWVDIGHQQAPIPPLANDYSQARNEHYRFDATYGAALGACNYGPSARQIGLSPVLGLEPNRVFDTWYPRLPWNSTDALHPAPFRPIRYRWQPTPNEGQSVAGIGSLGARGFAWTAGAPFRVNDLIFGRDGVGGTGAPLSPFVWVATASGTTSGANPLPPSLTSFMEEGTSSAADGTTGWKLLMNPADYSGAGLPEARPNWRASVVDPGGGGGPVFLTSHVYSTGDIVFPDPANMLPGRPFVYRCVLGAPDLSGRPGLEPPQWPQSLKNALPLTENDPITGARSAIWQIESNYKPMKAIRVRIRFLDPGTQQIRTETIVCSLLPRAAQESDRLGAFDFQ